MSPCRLYPEITSDEQRQQYKREFDSDLSHYKSLCAEMDDISDQMNKLSREMDTLDEDSIKYQVWRTTCETDTVVLKHPVSLLCIIECQYIQVIEVVFVFLGCGRRVQPTQRL